MDVEPLRRFNAIRSSSELFPLLVALFEKKALSLKNKFLERFVGFCWVKRDPMEILLMEEEENETFGQ